MPSSSPTKRIRASVRWPNRVARDEIVLTVRHYWDVLDVLMAEGKVPDEPFIIEVQEVLHPEEET